MEVELHALHERYKQSGDLNAREALIVHWMPLVTSIARRYAGRGERFEDVCQVGMIGLIKAVDRFDPARGFEFSTFATPTVLGEIKRYFRDSTALVRVPRPLQELGFRVQREAEALTATLGHAPTDAELAESLALDEGSVHEALTANRSHWVESLSALESDDDEAGGPPVFLAEEELGFARAEDRALLHDGFQALDDREREVLALRHGLELTQAQIARRIGCSQMNVSRVLRQANQKLERALGQVAA